MELKMEFDLLLTKDRTLELMACAAHMVNRAYCIALGDNSQLGWSDAPDWQRSSAIEGVKGALAGNTPKQSHECWLEEKRRAGWTYGPVKDPVKKTHPCFLDYEELPPEQQRKDLLFIATVRQVAALLVPDATVSQR